MNRLRYLLTDSRTLAIIGIGIMAGVFLLGRNALKMIAFWVGIALVALLIVLVVLWMLRRARARRSSEQLGEALIQQPGKAGAGGKSRHAEVDALRERLREAVKAIKTSRLGQTKGTEALYELPWYMIIGNPAAGKSTAIVNSGLRFPFADNHGSIVQGIGGTRNCDWYFTTEGILLDTAGRYSVHDENRSEWLSFLELLRKNRPRAPINGIIIAASIAELTGNRPEFAINLAKNLRQRVQELTEWLEVVAPVYVVFTKADLIAGFNDFFHTLDDGERERVWGATLPFQPDGNADGVEQFDRYFDELSEGLKEMSLSQMSLNRGNALAPGLLTLPLEFTGIKATLRTFIATLFEDNPFQFHPVFRGFYFTSALQETASVHHASDRIAKRYGLSAADAAPTATSQASAKGFFLLDLFRKVIFADKQLVRQHSSRNRTRTRYAVLLGSALALGLTLAGWAWSYTNNRQLVVNVQADLTKVEALQKDRVDLQSRLQALQIIQDRLQQLQDYRHDHPVMLGLGLYQGDAIEDKLRTEYFHGMRQLMVIPVTQGIEAYLDKVVAHRDRLVQTKPGTDTVAPVPVAPGTYQAPAPENTQDAYNALKAYLMLGDAGRVEPVHLSDQLTRFWREWLDANRGMMTRDQLIGTADHLMSFYVAQYDQPGWPTVDNKIALVDDTRQALRNVMRGMPAINRVYAELKARAATRYPSISVASILGDQNGKILVGSYAVAGSFSREAWEGYVKDAIRDAANNELNATDWVLQTTQQTDLTLSGSPEQIQKQLETLYDTDYVHEWQKFLQSVSVAPFDNFAAAVDDMNTLGDPQNSPMRKLIENVYQQTSWDNPSLVDQGLKSAQGGFVGWFKRVILRQQPRGVNLNLDNIKGPDGKLRTGPVGSAFAGVARLMVARDNNPPLLNNYLDMLAKLRTRLNAIKNQGDPGPGTRDLMQKTLSGSGSELSSGLQLVDEQMLDGLDDRQRNTLRPLLLRPLMQTFSALVQPTELEINKIWTAQVYTPFEANLSQKYPFDTSGQVQAADSEIIQVFGPSGAIAKFAGDTLGPLVDRRGDTLTAKQWADMGINLSPKLMTGLAQWVAPLGQTTGSGTQTIFKIQPEPGSGGISEYTITINGQSLRYRNTPPEWKPFVWDGSQANPVAQISAVTYDGRTVMIQDLSGGDALKKLFLAAKGNKDNNGVYTLTWSRDGIAVTARLQVVSGAQTNADGSQKQGLLGTVLPATVAGTSKGTDQARPTTEGAP
ncbi:type VI secretion system protein ImpL [Rhodanobacter sp. TND4EL1]